MVPSTSTVYCPVGDKSKNLVLIKAFSVGASVFMSSFDPRLFKTTHMSGLYPFYLKMTVRLPHTAGTINYLWWKGLSLALAQGVGDICWGCCFQGESSAKAETQVSCDW